MIIGTATLKRSALNRCIDSWQSEEFASTQQACPLLGTLGTSTALLPPQKL